MNKRIVIIAFLMLILLSLFVLSSCAGSEQTNSDDTQNNIQVETEYTVIFDSNGGSNVESQSVGLNKKIKEPEIPTRDGYVFDGWYAGSEKWVFLSHTIDDDITLVAKWKPNDNVLVFDANGGIGEMSNMTIATDTSINLSSNAYIKYGYTFKGWATNKDGDVAFSNGASYTMGTENLYILYAVWEKNINTLVFNGNSATSGSMQRAEVATDDTILLPQNSFIKNGYTFIGWSSTENGVVEYLDNANYTMGTESEYTLYAVWKANKNRLTFEANGADGGKMAEIVENTDYKFNLPQNEFIRKGYTFQGWSSTANGSVEYVDSESYTMGVNGSYTLYAVWEKDIYQIRYYNMLDVSPLPENPTEYDVYSKFEFNSPTREHYIFKGWFTDSLFENSITSIETGTTGNINLYAKWEAIQYTITYIIDNETETRMFTADVLPLKLHDLGDRSDHLFSGWYLSDDFNGMPVTQIEKAGDIKLYANYVIGTEGLLIGNTGVVCGYEGESANVVIPSVYKGIAVNSIFYDAFASSSIESVIIPDGVTKIEKGAFMNCTSLKSVTLPHTLTYIGRYAFYDCSSLESIIIPDSVIQIELWALFNCPAVVYCEAESRPEGWAEQWCIGVKEIVWGYKSNSKSLK